MPDIDLGIDPEEWLAIAIFGIFGAVWVFIVLPVFSNSAWFYTLSPFLAYPIYNIGTILIMTALLGIPLGYFVKGGEVDIGGMLRGGFASWLGFSWVIDNSLAGPFYLSQTGQVLLPINTSALENTAVDFFWAQIWRTVGVPNTLILPPWINYSWLYVFTYLVSDIIGIIVMAFILKPGVFLSMLGEE